MIKTFNTLYFSFSDSIEKHSILIFRISIAIVYIWFGALKVFGMSPAGELVEKQFIGLDLKYLFPFWEFLKLL